MTTPQEAAEAAVTLKSGEVVFNPGDLVILSGLLEFETIPNRWDQVGLVLGTTSPRVQRQLAPDVVRVLWFPGEVFSWEYEEHLEILQVSGWDDE